MCQDLDVEDGSTDQAVTFPVFVELVKLMSIGSVMPSSHLILWCPLLLPSIFPSIRVFPSESVLHIRWPKYWCFSFNISPSNEHLGLISFRMDWLDVLVVQGTLKSLLQYHSSKASILRCSAWSSWRVMSQITLPCMVWKRRQWQPTPVLLPGKSHGWRNLVGCSLWGLEESDTTERIHFHFSLSCIGEGNCNLLQCSCLENPRDGEPGGLPSMGLHRVGHD